MQQGYLCTPTDPRRIGTGDGETIILNSGELCQVITLQQNAKDQTIWMTTTQTGFPLEKDEDEVTNSKDTQTGITVRYLHPVMSTFITNWETALTSVGKQPSPLEQVIIDLENPSRITDSYTRITLFERNTPNIRQRSGLGSNTTKILTMGRTHTGLDHHYT
jgi:hypothetical protein